MPLGAACAGSTPVGPAYYCSRKSTAGWMVCLPEVDGPAELNASSMHACMMVLYANRVAYRMHAADLRAPMDIVCSSCVDWET